MPREIEATINKLIDTLAGHKAIRSIGLSGGERPFPESGEGDIDIFIYCAKIPASRERQKLLGKLQEDIKEFEIGKLAGGHWGQGDWMSIAGVETWLLYFTVTEARAELEATLAGKYLGRQDSYYYPIGRFAMWKTMRVLYDPDGILESFRQQLADYPQGLQQKIVNHHVKALEDVEDLERAVARKDLFFFHFAMDLALDHFLQALFALNKEYFPSRKRSEVYLRDFKVKPVDCEQRFHRLIALGGNVETLDQSYCLWKDLVSDLKSL
jgi:hypothetical protein